MAVNGDLAIFYTDSGNRELIVKIQDIKELNNKNWKEHILFLKKQYPKYNYV
jgi:hypothetical protein